MKSRIKARWGFRPVFYKGRLRYEILPHGCSNVAFDLSHEVVVTVQLHLMQRIDDEADRLEGRLKVFA